MRSVTHIETYDGALHDTGSAAIHHLEKKLGDVMLPLAKQIVNDPKYGKVCDLLNASTETLREIVRIQDDMKMEAREE